MNFLAGVMLGSLLTGLALWAYGSTRFAPDGTALILHHSAGPRVILEPVRYVRQLQPAQEVSLAPIPITLTRSGSEGLICADGIRADVTAVFTFGICRNPADILAVVKALGVERASDPAVVQGLLEAALLDALTLVAGQHDFDTLHTNRDLFKDDVIGQVGQYLHGFTLLDLSFTRLEQTPISQLDPSNIRDAKGILKITQQTAAAEQERLALGRRLANIEGRYREEVTALEELIRMRGVAEAEVARLSGGGSDSTAPPDTPATDALRDYLDRLRRERAQMLEGLAKL